VTPSVPKCRWGTLASEHAGLPAGRHEPRVEPVVANRESQRRRRLTLACWTHTAPTRPCGNRTRRTGPPQVADQRVCGHRWGHRASGHTAGSNNQVAPTTTPLPGGMRLHTERMKGHTWSWGESNPPRRSVGNAWSGRRSPGQRTIPTLTRANPSDPVSTPVSWHAVARAWHAHRAVRRSSRLTTFPGGSSSSAPAVRRAEW
jgi:hypothetical protein